MGRDIDSARHKFHIFHIRRTFRACIKGRAKPHGSRKSNQPRHATSPSSFDTGQAALDTVLLEYLDLSPGDAHPLEAMAWLPSSKSGPVPSNRLLHDVEKVEASLRLRPWRVSARRLDSQESVTALTNCQASKLSPAAFFLGMTLRIGGNAQICRCACCQAALSARSADGRRPLLRRMGTDNYCRGTATLRGCCRRHAPIGQGLDHV